MREQEETCSVEEAARLAEVRPETIRRWIASHYLRAYRVSPLRGAWRVDMADLKSKLGLAERKA